MPTPNHPALPLCCQLAAQPGRYLFAQWLDAMQSSKQEFLIQAGACRLKGMLAAYVEMDAISADQFEAMADEIHAFAFGATV